MIVYDAGGRPLGIRGSVGPIGMSNAKIHHEANAMTDERTQEQIDRLAQELAQRVMSKPPQPQAWPKKPKATPAAGDASKPKKRGRAASAS